MDLLHHDLHAREEDGQLVCTRCGLVNPADNQPCIPQSAEPTELDLAA